MELLYSHLFYYFVHVVPVIGHFSEGIWRSNGRIIVGELSLKGLNITWSQLVDRAEKKT